MTRRDFLGSSAAAALTPLAGASTKRPNIVVMLADDMGYSDIGCYGGEVQTPNLDRLAQMGIRFTQFYNCARCCPTRASLLTGLDNHQAGVGDMVNPRPIPAYQGYLNDRCVTIAEALRPSGYHPLMSGKWHVGEHRPHWPTDRGFEHYFGLISGASSYWELEPPRQMAIDDRPYTPSGKFYMTDAIADHAIDMINEYSPKPEPYFLYTAFTAPHWPLHAWPEDIAKYRGKYRKGWDRLRTERYARQVRMKLIDPKWALSPRDPDVPAWESVSNQDEFDLRMAVYAAQIDRMDQNIGRILAALKESGQSDNTLILFLSDNGACHEEKIQGEKVGVPPGPRGSFTSYSRNWANASNTPFRMFKHWVHEGGIATPLIASWPSVIRRGGSLNHEPGHVTDIMATCLDVAGAEYPRTYNGKPITPLESKSLRPALEGKPREPRDAYYWEHEGSRAIRQGNWKLVSKPPSDTWELYDLAADRSENHDLASANPAKVRELQRTYQTWADRVGVVPPSELKRISRQATDRSVVPPGKRADDNRGASLYVHSPCASPGPCKSVVA